MKTLAPIPGCSRKHVSAVAHHESVNAKIGEFRWPLDVGERTARQVADLAPWLNPGTIRQRLEAGERCLDKLIRKPSTPSERSKIASSNFARMFAAEAQRRLVNSERIAYYGRKKSGHKKL